MTGGFGDPANIMIAQLFEFEKSYTRRVEHPTGDLATSNAGSSAERQRGRGQLGAGGGGRIR